ncbi:winged helix-turn-helix transcriptional regulator [Sulfurospirillum sp.]|uniref:winged helix-turn-helix transcriptional regulator n=1 Tax=Sulfurospirillum sp. TaxID=2053622 RepID=UPI002FDEB1B6
MYYINEKEYDCSVAVTLDVFNDRWKLAIIWHLLEKNKRFKELSEDINEITQKTLTIKLKELEEKKIIAREVFPEIPPKVVYSLTPIGKALRPILEAMYVWGKSYVEAHGKVGEELVCEASVLKALGKKES